MSGISVSVGQSIGFVWNGSAWFPFGAVNSVSNLAEFGTLQIPTQTNALVSTVPFNVSGSTFTLPSAGTWEISYNVMTSAPATIVTYSIVDSAGVAVSSSGSTAGFFNATTQTYEHVSKTFLVTTTGAKSLKMIVVAGNNQSVSINSATNDAIYNNPPGNSQISWKKVSGFLPVTGQSVDYLKVKRITSSPTIALNTDILFNSIPTGNIPYNTTTGLATLTANKTYRIRAVLVGRNDGTGTTGRYITYDIKTSANTDLPATANPTQGVQFLASSVNNEGGGSEATAEFTPSVNTDIKIRLTGIDGNNWSLDTERSYLEITQLGSSAVYAGVYPGVWTNYTPTITATASGTNPTLPTGATITGSYTVQGRTMFLNVRYSSLGTAGGATGTQSYSFGLPAGFTIDLSKAPLPTDVTNTSLSGFDGSSVGNGFARNSANSGAFVVMPVTSTGVGGFVENNVRLIGAGSFALNGASNTIIGFTAQIPIN
jgi:hypothetical protein